MKGIDVAQYSIVQPVFVTALDRSSRLVLLQPGTPATLVMKAWSVRSRCAHLPSKRSRFVCANTDSTAKIMRAYRRSCTVCSLKRAELLQAAHITAYQEEDAVTEVTNGLALCAIHHLAYDRNLLGIDPGGVVHIAKPLLVKKRTARCCPRPAGLPRCGDPAASGSDRTP